MSVIVALISNRDGVVVSDGRLFGSALLDNGRVTQPASIESDEFDKTFSLGRGKLIGAFSGLMRFSGKTVSEHVSEVAVPLLCRPVDLQTLTKEIEKEITQRLAHIDDREVIFPCRRLDMLLVAGMNLSRSEIRIVSIRFYPKDNVMTWETDTVAADRANRYCVRGEDHAAAAADRLLANNHAPNRDAAFLKKLATKAVQSGIRAAGTHPHGSDPACGKKIFVRGTLYK
jgi:hypothetical protein